MVNLSASPRRIDVRTICLNIFLTSNRANDKRNIGCFRVAELLKYVFLLVSWIIDQGT